MSILRLADGTKLKIETPSLNPQGSIENRTRPTIDFSAMGADIRALSSIEQKALDASLTETMTVFFNEDDPATDDDILDGVDGDPENAPAKQVLKGYTVLGKVDKERAVLTEATMETPPVYGWKLTVQLGQRLWDE